MLNKNKIVLDLCGGSGTWSNDYKKAGYDVRIITLPAYNIFHYRPPTKNVFGILAAPVCTQFSLARTTAKTPRDFKEGMRLVKACLEIIWTVRVSQPLRFWALENPRGYLRQFLGTPAFTFEQWEFGDEGIKPTDIWGYFKKPAKSVKSRPAGLSKQFPNGRFNAIGWSKKGPAERAKTSPGFAKAFYEANSWAY